MDKTLEAIFKCFGNEIYKYIDKIEHDINEVRIHSGRPIVLYIGNTPYVIRKNGYIETLDINCNYDNYISVSFGVIKEAFARLCEFSVYKYQHDINNGFITVKGGHRIGICGTAVLSDKELHSVINITDINIRAAREYIGCSDSLLKQTGTNTGILLCGVPSTGKTTLLRDISRNLSVCYLKKVSVIDERSELSSTFHGISSFDLGLSDIYSCYPKKTAIVQAIRTMSPDFIVCDELTGDDIESVMLTLNYGVKIISSVHCDSFENALKNPFVFGLIQTGAFKKIVFLQNGNFCKINKIYSLEKSDYDKTYGDIIDFNFGSSDRSAVNFNFGRAYKDTHVN